MPSAIPVPGGESTPAPSTAYGGRHYSQDYPFRFIGPDEFATMLNRRGFKILRNERIGRTYRNMAEYFEFVSIHAEKAN
jgi:hypothetical protein